MLPPIARIMVSTPPELSVDPEQLSLSQAGYAGDPTHLDMCPLGLKSAAEAAPPNLGPGDLVRLRLVHPARPLLPPPTPDGAQRGINFPDDRCMFCNGRDGVHENS